MCHKQQQADSLKLSFTLEMCGVAEDDGAGVLLYCKGGSKIKKLGGGARKEDCIFLK